MLLDIPSQKDYDNSQKIDFIAAQSGIQDVDYDADKLQGEYLGEHLKHWQS